MSSARSLPRSNSMDASVDLDRDRDPITLTRFILAEQQKHKTATGDFSLLLQSVQLACKVISKACAKAGIANLYGVSGDSNSSGDTQKKLDVFSNDCFINSLSFSSQICLMVSEENEDPVPVEVYPDGKYVICFDPLDGSSNIDANVSVGTIFGIFRRNTPQGSAPETSDVLRVGNELVCAGYALYGAATMLVLSFGEDVQGFTLDPSLGEFILTHPDIRIPTSGKIYSINEGNSLYWDEATTRFVQECKAEPKSARYVGSMVADVHRTILYGGIFCYPGTTKSPKGKLRLLYEAAPMAFIVKAAGGASTTGTGDVLDVQPDGIHDKCPIFLGSQDDVRRVRELYAELGN